MTRDDIIRMAQEAEVKPMLYDGKWAIINLDRFFHMAQAAEREACAKLADAADMYNRYISQEIAAAIRARGQA